MGLPISYLGKGKSEQFFALRDRLPAAYRRESVHDRGPEISSHSTRSLLRPYDDVSRCLTCSKAEALTITRDEQNVWLRYAGLPIACDAGADRKFICQAKSDVRRLLDDRDCLLKRIAEPRGQRFNRNLG